MSPEVRLGRYQWSVQATANPHQYLSFRRIGLVGGSVNPLPLRVPKSSNSTVSIVPEWFILTGEYVDLCSGPVSTTDYVVFTLLPGVNSQFISGSQQYPREFHHGFQLSAGFGRTLSSVGEFNTGQVYYRLAFVLDLNPLRCALGWVQKEDGQPVPTGWVGFGFRDSY